MLFRSVSQSRYPLPKLAETNSFFSGNQTPLTIKKQRDELYYSPKKEEIQQKEKTESKPMTLIPNVPDLTPVNDNKQQTEPFKLDSKSNIMVGNVSKDNLIKTESISKTNFNISEINQKNKEILNMEQKLKELRPLPDVRRPPQPMVVNNNYGQGDSGSRISRSDPLAGIKNTLRSYPSWRIEMG